MIVRYTNDEIKDRVTRLTAILIGELAKGGITQQDYDEAIRELNEWAKLRTDENNGGS
jgi:uncharacterized membrane protein